MRWCNSSPNPLQLSSVRQHICRLRINHNTNVHQECTLTTQNKVQLYYERIAHSTFHLNQVQRKTLIIYSSHFPVSVGRRPVIISGRQQHEPDAQLWSQNIRVEPKENTLEINGHTQTCRCPEKRFSSLCKRTGKEQYHTGLQIRLCFSVKL